MTRTTVKNPWGLRPVYRVGLGFVVVGVAVLIGLELAHPRPRIAKARPPVKHIPQVSITEIPPMVIDADELALAGRERHDNVLEMVFCWCPAGRFSVRGGARDRAGPRGPNRDWVWVTLSRGYWIGKFEVTQAQWQRVMGKTLLQQRAMDPKQPRPLGDGSKRPHAGVGPDYPIYFTSFDEAEEFCQRLTEAERRAGRLDAGWIYRLPTDAEWEFACRAGTTTATAFGNHLEGSQANFDGEVPLNKTVKGAFVATTKPVGSYPSNAWGLHDMHGNVWEWCRGVHGPAPGRPAPPSPGKRQIPEEPIRGGAWYDPGWLCQSTSWFHQTVTARGSGLGFRVALVSTELWREAEGYTIDAPSLAKPDPSIAGGQLRAGFSLAELPRVRVTGSNCPNGPGREIGGGIPQ